MRMKCPLVVWDENEFDIYPIGHCRCDGQWCKTEGDWDKCRLNFPIISVGCTDDGGEHVDV